MPIESHPLFGAIALAAISVSTVATEVVGEELERPRTGEPEAIRTIVSLALAELEHRYPPGASLVRRDAHAKGHGCVKAIFHVDREVPADLRVGFAAIPDQEYKAWVRFSNGAFEPGADSGMDGRGMALKIINSAPTALAPTGPVSSHDLLMINYPVFFSTDALDYMDFASSGGLTGNPDELKRYFVPSFNPLRWRYRQALIAYRIASTKITSPLSTQYYSMVPFLFGSGRAVKYSARPCHGSPANDGQGPANSGAVDFLKSTMQYELDLAPACFDLLVQEKRGTMPIEDATIEWSEAESPFRRVGTISIPQQKFEAAERSEFCENVTFNPWNAPPEQKPLGSINRVRKALYDEISRYRHSRNKSAVPDAEEAWGKL